MSGSTTYRFGVRFEGNAAGLAKSAKEAEQMLKVMGKNGMAEYKRMAQAREVLGVKSEREVQREIQRTEAAYNRLARSGTLSWHEQRMAAQKMREEVTRLTNEMGRLTTRQKISLGAKGVAAVGAGAGVATAIVAPRVRTAIDYDRRLADLANTAYAERNTAGRKAGMRDLDRMLIDAVRYGGGTRDSAAGTAETLFGAGVFKPDEIAKILRESVRAGTGGNADPALFAQMAVTANQTMGIKPDQMGRMFGMGTYAGQQGGFEIKDMAKWLPSQMAAAKAVGMFGEGGFAKLAALNQASIVTAGSRDEAGNNVVNLLAKLGSQDTIKDFKRQGVDLPKQLAQGRLLGQDAVDVVGNLLQQQLSKDPNYQAAQKQLAAAKNDEDRRAAFQSVSSIAQGTTIGKVFQDRQALMALYGYVQNRDRVGAIERGALSNTNASDRNFDLISQTPSFKVQQAKNEAEIAQQHSIDKLTPALGSLADKTAALVREYPVLSTAIVATTAALAGLATTAGALAVLGGKLPGGLGGGGGAAGGAAKAGLGARALAMLGPVAGAAGAIYAGKGGLNWIEDQLWKGMSPDGIDPRLAANTPKPVSERIGSASSALPFLQQDLKGEILVRVTGAPGLNVEAETKSNSPRIPFRADVGRTNMSAGF